MLSVSGNRSVTLGGKVSKVTVLVHNPLSYSVKVRLKVRASKNISVSLTQPATIRVDANSYSTQIKLTVHAAGTAPGTIRLSLTSPGGTPLPVVPLIMHIRSTDFGTVALVILSAALAVFVLASAARAIRPGRGPRPPSGAPAEAGPPPSASPQDEPSPQGQSTDRPELTAAGRGGTDTEPAGTLRPTEER
jgi:Family of unknown function (DUF6049)